MGGKIHPALAFARQVEGWSPGIFSQVDRCAVRPDARSGSTFSGAHSDGDGVSRVNRSCLHANQSAGGGAPWILARRTAGVVLALLGEQRVGEDRGNL